MYVAGRIRGVLSVRGTRMDEAQIHRLVAQCRAETLELLDAWHTGGVADLAWCTKVASVLRLKTRLRHLDMSGVPLARDGATAVVDAFCANCIMSSLRVRVRCSRAEAADFVAAMDTSFEMMEARGASPLLCVITEYEDFVAQEWTFPVPAV